MEKEQILAFAQTLWDYHHMNMPLEPADVILVMGSHDLRVGEYGARLWLEGWAPWLLLSGGLGNLTRRIWDEPEAKKFAFIAREIGVPDERILVEDCSTNTGENVLFSRALLEERGISANTFLLVQKPYMERRAYATFRKLWPEKAVRVSSPPIPFRDYFSPETPFEVVINVMVGDLQRILLYPAKGFQVPQQVPPEVLAAYEALIAAGYDQHLIK